MSEWIPLISEKLPAVGEVVQVTYLDIFSLKPNCDMFAYLTEDGFWFNAYNDQALDICITAWKRNCEPYDGPFVSITTEKLCDDRRELSEMLRNDKIDYFDFVDQERYLDVVENTVRMLANYYKVEHYRYKTEFDTLYLCTDSNES